MRAPLPSRFIIAVDPVAPPPGLAACVVAIGNFDGVHRGHQAVIARAKSLADDLGQPCAVLTFEPHPADLFAQRGTIFRITPEPVKALALARLGTVDGMVVRSFDRAFASLSAEEFVSDVLVRSLGVAAAVVGYDFHFGKGRMGSPEFLIEAGRRLGFGVAVIAKITTDQHGALDAVSSTAIRRLLEAGRVRDAAVLLGRPYFVLGPVIHGRKLGRTLGFPTANISLDPSIRLAHGIYAVRTSVDGVVRPGVASFGRRPTFDNGSPLLEVYLFDFDGDLYDRTIEVDFVDWLRGEAKFDGVEALVEQMRSDEALARRILLEPDA